MKPIHGREILKTRKKKLIKGDIEKDKREKKYITGNRNRREKGDSREKGSNREKGNSRDKGVRKEKGDRTEKGKKTGQRKETRQR